MSNEPRWNQPDRDGENLGSRLERSHSSEGWGSSPREVTSSSKDCDGPHDESGEHLGGRGSPHLSPAEHEAIREGLAIDIRAQHTEALQSILDEIGVELGRIQRLADALPIDYPTPQTATELVGKLAQSKRVHRTAAVIGNLLDEAERTSVALGRAHGLTWDDIAAARQEAQPNTVHRFRDLLPR